MAVSITIGHLAQHTPRGAGSQGRDAALVDVAQDLLLRHLHAETVLDGLAFKGGTALRKMYAGKQGRFSLDLDFSVVEIGANIEDQLDLLAIAVDRLSIGPFDYSMTQRRGKRSFSFSSPTLGSPGTLHSKLDVSAPPWLTPVRRGWEPMTVHRRYGDPPLPELQIVRLEENVAEKIARLNRVTPARDLYDLRWVFDNHLRGGGLDPALIRHLAVLKMWVDAHGLHATGPAGESHWPPAHSSAAFEPQHWLRTRTRDEFDEEDIGALAVPVPTFSELADVLGTGYSFVAELTPDERQVARGLAADRPLVLHLLRELPGSQLASAPLR